MFSLRNLQKSLEALRDPDRLWRREKRPFWLFKNLLIMVSGSSEWYRSQALRGHVRSAPHLLNKSLLHFYQKAFTEGIDPAGLASIEDLSMKISVQCRSRERCQALCSRGSTSPLSWSSPNPLAEHRAEIWDKLAGSFNDSFARKRYSEAPFFYKYLPLPLSLSLCDAGGLGPLSRLRTDPETACQSSKGRRSD